MRNFFRKFHYMDTQKLPYIKGIGKSEGGKHYFCNGEKRKDHLIVMQYTLEGKGYFIGSGKKYILESGDFFIAEIPGKFQYYGEDWSFLYIEFSPIVRQWLQDPIQVCRQSSSLFDENIKSLLAYLEGHSKLDLFENARLTFDYCLQIKKEIQLLKVERNPLATELKKFLEAHFATDISLEQVAAHFQLSVFQTIRLFEASFHCSPMAYLRKYRILQSLEGLWRDQSIKETAYQVGFNSQNYFSKVFKKEMRMSPTEYKKENQKT